MPWAHAPWDIMQEGRDAEDADAGHCVHGSTAAHFGREDSPPRPVPAGAAPPGVVSLSAEEPLYSIVVERLDQSAHANIKETRRVIFQQLVATLDLKALIALVNK